MTQIRASAGSGKTYRLTEEYIRKLTGHGALSRDMAAAILAVTFTNAAANEMRSRVLKRLKESALGGNDGEAENARNWLELFLNDLGALNIRTIDSLLHQIVRASAIDLNVSPDYETEFDAKEALAPHVELALEAARMPGSEQELIRNICYSEMDRSKPGFPDIKLLGKVNELLPLTLAGSFDSLSTVDEIKAAIEEIPGRLASAAAKLLDLAAAENLKCGNSQSTLEKYAHKDFQPSFPAAAKKESAGELFKKDSVSPEIEGVFAEFKESANLYYYGRKLLENGLRHKPFIDFCKKVSEAYLSQQAEAGILVESLVPTLAARALDSENGVSDALCRLGTRLAHFLVDEFQDTSREQWNVLHALAHDALSRGGSLTWVGDIKQSIYGWRGGDPLLFDEALRDTELTSIVKEPKVVTLDSNWRSLPEIVRHGNELFAPLLNREVAEKAAEIMLGDKAPAAFRDELAKRLIEAYGDVEQKCKKTDKGPGYVKAETVAAENDMASAMSERVCELLKDDIGRRWKWSDVMILVRSDKQARQIAERLGEAKIPVITENGLLLNENALIIQSVAFLSFLENTQNDAAFWTVLNGAIFAGSAFAPDFAPFGGMESWAAAREKWHLYEQFREDFPDIWHQVFAPFLNNYNPLTAYDSVSEWYRRLDVERRFQDDRTMLRRFLEILHLAENAGMASIARFLEYWSSNSGAEKAPMPGNMNAVRIMTIHKAKGLEAPVVVVPNIEYNIRPSETPEPRHICGLTVASAYTKDTGPAYYGRMLPLALEAVNLLYVAVTRARDELYLLLPERKTSEKGTRIPVRLLFERGGFTLPYERGARRQAPEGHVCEFSDAEANQPAVSHRPIDAREDWSPKSWLPRLKVYHTELTSSTLTPRQRGTILHACLEYMVFKGDAAASARAALKSGLTATGIAMPEGEKSRLLRALSWFASNVPLQEWLAKGWREQPLINAGGETLRADLIIPYPWGSLVVDYKSGEPRDEDISQIREYMRVLADSGQFSGKVCGLLVYMDKQAFKRVKVKKGINLVKTAPGAPSADIDQSELLNDLPALP